MEYDNTLVCGECRAKIHASVDLTDRMREFYRAQGCEERDRYRVALETIREMMSPANRQRFVTGGPMAFAGVYNVVEDALDVYNPKPLRPIRKETP